MEQKRIEQKQKIKNLYKEVEVVNTFDNDRNIYEFQKVKHKFEWSILHNIVKKYTKRKRVKVLDVACGTGRMFKEIEKYDVEYYGVDTSQEMMSHLKSYADKINRKINLTIGDAINLPYADNTFDIVYSFHLTWHLPEELQHMMIKEMERVTKPGGHYIFDILNKDFYWEKIKHIFGIKRIKYIYKLSTKSLKFSSKSVEKHNDFPIQNYWIYSALNLINYSRKMLPINMFHMLYYDVKKNV